jgi:LacI family transcriptional regulator
VVVPGDLSVIGFDDIDMARYMAPPLTTIHQPKANLGRTAMKMLLDLLDGRPVSTQILTPTLVRRASAARHRVEHIAPRSDI